MTRRLVRGACPNCGEENLGLTSSGDVICCSGCDRPTAAAEILTDTETGHIVVLSRDDFTLRHPLIERLDGALFTCRLHEAIATSDRPPAPPGRYRAALDEHGLHLDPLSAAALTATPERTNA